MENHHNIKLDYLIFRAENTARFFHQVASKNGEILEKKLVSSILQLQHEIGDNRLFPIAPPEFGMLRGEVLSTMTCQVKDYKVNRSPSICTEEIQAFDEDGKKIYIAMISRLVQEVYSKQDCPSEDMGLVFSATTKQGSEIHVVQIPRLVTLPAQFITGPALDHQTFYHTEKINLTQQLSYSSFDQSRVYSEEFL